MKQSIFVKQKKNYFENKIKQHAIENQLKIQGNENLITGGNGTKNVE